jgi:hypothetical protein
LFGSFAFGFYLAVADARSGPTYAQFDHCCPDLTSSVLVSMDVRVNLHPQSNIGLVHLFHFFHQGSAHCVCFP